VGSFDFNGVGSSGAVSFDTTHWSIVSAAADSVSPNAEAALETLCRTYWYPLYSYIRRKGYSAADAQDMTQEFFCRLIGKKYLASVDRSAGSFRSFLLACVNHLLANEWDKSQALKRGGGREFISLDSEEAESRFAQEGSVSDSPERAYDRRWALTLLDQALVRLRAEFTNAGKLPQFDLLKGFLSNLAGEGDYAATAGTLGLDANGVAVAVHRLRRRYREIVRTEIAQTVTTEADLDAEMDHLFGALD
jgi:RNA polymerase sigma factor (sigma-70 family)